MHKGKPGTVRFVKINSGVTVEVVTDQTANEADWVVCVRANSPTAFDDDEYGLCSVCQEVIRFRPSVPDKPPKICIVCLSEKLNESGDEDDVPL